MDYIDNLLLHLLLHPVQFICVLALLGLLVGSFLNVVILRIPKMLQKEWYTTASDYLKEQETAPDLPERYNLVTPASHCTGCQKEIKPWENIPIISYLFLQGKCSNCKTPISIRYPLIELATGLLTALVAWHFGLSWLMAASLILLWSLIALTMIDFDTKLLPDQITLPLIWLGLLVNLNGLIVPLEEAVIGAIAGYLSLWSVYWLFKLLTGKEGMGYGDFKLLAALGAWLGWKTLPSIILISSFVGACVGIIVILFFKHDRHQGIPFGPYLAAAGVIALLYGDFVVQLFPL